MTVFEKRPMENCREHHWHNHATDHEGAKILETAIPERHAKKAVQGIWRPRDLQKCTNCHGAAIC